MVLTVAFGRALPYHTAEVADSIPASLTFNT